MLRKEKKGGEIWINRDFAAQLNAIFGDLERDRIPYGVLYDYALPLVDLQAYNGVLTDSTLIDLGVMSDIYKTLQLARIHPKFEKDFIAEEDWAQRWANYRKQHNNEKELTTIVLSGLHYRYAVLPEQSFEQSKIKDGSRESYECVFELKPVEETENTYEVVRVEIIEESIKYVQLLPEDRVEIRAYNTSGQNVLRATQNRIDLSNLDNGIYILNASINEREKIELKVYKK